MYTPIWPPVRIMRLFPFGGAAVALLHPALGFGGSPESLRTMGASVTEPPSLGPEESALASICPLPPEPPVPALPPVPAPPAPFVVPAAPALLDVLDVVCVVELDVVGVPVLVVGVPVLVVGVPVLDVLDVLDAPVADPLPAPPLPDDPVDEVEPFVPDEVPGDSASEHAVRVANEKQSTAEPTVLRMATPHAPVEAMGLVWTSNGRDDGRGDAKASPS